MRHSFNRTILKEVLQRIQLKLLRAMSQTIQTDDKPMAELLQNSSENSGEKSSGEETSSDENYSGETTITLSKTLHRKLSAAAQAEGIDLNQYIVTLLNEHSTLDAVSGVQAKLDAVNQRLREREAVMRQMERRARERRLSYDNRYIEDVDSGLND